MCVTQSRGCYFLSRVRAVCGSVVPESSLRGSARPQRFKVGYKWYGGLLASSRVPTACEFGLLKAAPAKPSVSVDTKSQRKTSTLDAAPQRCRVSDTHRSSLDHIRRLEASPPPPPTAVPSLTQARQRRRPPRRTHPQISASKPHHNVPPALVRRDPDAPLRWKTGESVVQKTAPALVRDGRVVGVARHFTGGDRLGHSISLATHRSETPEVPHGPGGLVRTRSPHGGRRSRGPHVPR